MKKTVGSAIGAPGSEVSCHEYEPFPYPPIAENPSEGAQLAVGDAAIR